MKSIDVFGVEYIIDEYCEIDSDGLCCPVKHEISLKKSTRDRESLLHEVGHVILFEGGLFCAIDEGIREVIAQQFAQIINKNFSIRLKK